MRNYDTEDKILHEKFEQLGGPVPSSCKKQIREARKRLKREMSKHRRLTEKQETERLVSDAGL